MIDMAIDKNNFCWLSFPNGIQRFDGKSFINVEVQPGLPEDKWVRFFSTKNKEILISHAAGISKYENAGNSFRLVYATEHVPERPAAFLGEDDGVVYIYDKQARIIGLDTADFKVVAETASGLQKLTATQPFRLTVSSNIINHKLAILANGRLNLWDLQKRKLLYQSDSIADLSSYTAFLKSESEVLYEHASETKQLMLYNFKSKNSTALLTSNDYKSPTGWRSGIYQWGEKILISIGSHLFETDTSFRVLKSELVNFQNEGVSAQTRVARAKQDNFGNLIIATVTLGLRKIIRNNYPIKYYGTQEQKNNFILSILPDKKNNKILAGTSGNGLLIFDTLQGLVKHIPALPGRKNGFFVNAMIKDAEGNYILFVAHERWAWQLKQDLSAIKPVEINSKLPVGKIGVDYYALTLLNNAKEGIVHAQNRFYRMNLAGNIITEKVLSFPNYPLSSLLYGSVILTHANDDLIFLDTTSFNEIKRIPFKNTGQVRCFAMDATQAIYMGTNKGIFKIDGTGKILAHLDKTAGLPDECIYAIAIDKNGALWCSSNKGIFRIDKNNSILQLTKDDGLQENEFNTNVVAVAEDGELFFGGVNGVSSFYPSAIRSFENKPTILITGIRVNNEDRFRDIAPWAMEKIVLPYNQNSISFDFIGMGDGNPEQYIYQYRMQGLEKEWIQNSGTQPVRYFLQPGTYTLQLYASREFEAGADPLKEIIIIIKPPFWKTGWFLTLMGLIFISVLAFIINQNTKRKYAKKLHQLESERQLKLERERISKDLHDSLGAYANAVLYNTELLEKEKDNKQRTELISDLKFASKDIITALRETVWALKRETYTAEDCLVRIKNFMQPFTRYYSHIHFRVEGEPPAGLVLHYTKALNLVRMIQEAISNSIKHAEPSNIVITNYAAGDRWKLVVSDDGKGFDYPAMKGEERGNGLNNLDHRAVESAFELSINPQKNKGTEIIIIV